MPEGYPKLCYLLWAPFKAAFLAIQLFWVMGCITQRPDFIIVQVRKKKKKFKKKKKNQTDIPIFRTHHLFLHFSLDV